MQQTERVKDIIGKLENAERGFDFRNETD